MAKQAIYTRAERGLEGVAGLVDVETTGLSPRYDEIIEISCCLFSFSRQTGIITGVLEEYTGLREPTRPISRGAARVHSISSLEFKGRQLDRGRIEELLQRAEFVIAHNARFDRGFVVKIFAAGREKRWLCSMSGINWRQEGFRSRRLQHLLQAHGIQVQRAHRAEEDVKAVLKLLSCSCSSSGRSYLYELLKKNFPSALEDSD